MKLSLILPLLLASFAALAQEGMPRMSSVEPMAGKIGDVVAVTGENLEKNHVAKVYLTNGKDDLECVVTEQTATSLKVKIPEKAKGRMALMILTAGKEERLLEQPVKVTIE